MSKIEESFYEGISRLNTDFREKIGLIDEKSGITFSYKSIFEIVNKCVVFLKNKGLKEGDAFQVVLPNTVEMVIFFLAAGRGGFKFAPCSEESTDKEILTYNKITNSRLVIFSQKNNLSNIFPKALNKIAIKLDCKFNWLKTITSFNIGKAKDGNLYIMTSGTTGTPKAIVLSLDKLWASTISFNNNYKNINIESVFWNYLPMSYLGGLYNLALIPLSAGAQTLISASFDASTSFKFWPTIKKYKINILWLVPSLVRVLQKLSMRNSKIENIKFGKKIKMALLGTAPISLHEKINFEKTFGINIYENYGLSETNFISIETDQSKKYRLDASVGSILPYVKLNIKNNSINQQEIKIKSPYLFLGYLGKDGKKTFKLSSKDYFSTGDIGEVKDNQLILKGRSREIIKKGGYLIQLREIEEEIKKIKELNEVAAVAYEDDFYGENYVIFYEGLNDESTKIIIRSALEKSFSIRKHPKEIFWIPEIPKTKSGKIKKNEIKKFIPSYFAKPVIQKSKALNISKIVKRIKPALSIEINQLVYNMRRAGEKITALSLGEAFFDIPRYSFGRLDFQKGYHYSDTAGSPEIRNIISKYYQTKYNAPVFQNEIIVSAGSKPLIYMIMRSILNEGDEVLIHEPAWLSYEEHATLSGAKTKYIPYEIKVNEFSKYFKNKTKMIIINNPNNPRGKIYSEAELRDIYKVARKHGAYVLIDEAYSDFVKDDFVSLANIVPDKEGIIIVNSLSKNLGISGWRVGYAICSNDIKEQLLKLNQHIITCAPTILSMYIEKYFEKMLEHTSEQIRQLLIKRTAIMKYMNKIGLSYLDGNATFYFFISIEKFPGSDKDFANLLLIENKISVVPGSAYGRSTDRYIRVSIGTENKTSIIKALNKIKEKINISTINKNYISKKIKEWSY